MLGIKKVTCEGSPPEYFPKKIVMHELVTFFVSLFKSYLGLFIHIYL